MSVNLGWCPKYNKRKSKERIRKDSRNKNKGEHKWLILSEGKKGVTSLWKCWLILLSLASCCGIAGCDAPAGYSLCRYPGLVLQIRPIQGKSLLAFH